MAAHYRNCFFAFRHARIPTLADIYLKPFTGEGRDSRNDSPGLLRCSVDGTETARGLELDANAVGAGRLSKAGAGKPLGALLISGRVCIKDKVATSGGPLDLALT